MILFLNVFVTEKALNLYDRGLYGPVSDRLAVFKYSLASFAVIPWSKVVIYCELDQPFKARQSELDQFISSNFNDAEVHWRRNTKSHEWKSAVQRLLSESEDALIWFFCNDDHIFIDSDLNLLEKIQTRMIELQSEFEYVSCYTSHWPEQITFIDPERKLHYEKDRAPLSSDLYEKNASYFVNRWYNFDSVQIVNRNLLKAWWLDHDYGDAFLPRTDYPPCVKSPDNIACIIPGKELVRHYDAYSHVGLDINICPPLNIPQGFFENQIKICYGGKQRLPGYTLINPQADYHRCVSPEGVDAKWLLEDIPLFWKNRIAETLNSSEQPEADMIAWRNKAVLNLASLRLKHTADQIADEFAVAFRWVDGAVPLPDRITPPEKAEYETVLRESQRVGTPKLSVILLEDQKGRFGINTLNELRDQKFPREDFEIIWVSATDYYLAELSQYADCILKSVQSQHWSMGTLHRGRALNQAILKARGELLVICDSAMSVHSSFISRIYSWHEAEQGEAVLVTGLPAIDPNTSEKLRPCIAVKRELIFRARGFDQDARFLGDAGGVMEILPRLIEMGVRVISEVSMFGPMAGVSQAGKTTSLIEIRPYAHEREVSRSAQTKLFKPNAAFASTSHENSAPRPVTEIKELPENLDWLLKDLNFNLICANTPAVMELVDQLVATADPLTALELINVLRSLLDGNAKEAHTYAEALARFYTGSAEVQNLFGIVDFAAGDMDSARTALAQCLEQHPANRNALILIQHIDQAKGIPASKADWRTQLKKYYPEFSWKV